LISSFNFGTIEFSLKNNRRRDTTGARDLFAKYSGEKTERCVLIQATSNVSSHYFQLECSGTVIADKFKFKSKNCNNIVYHLKQYSLPVFLSHNDTRGSCNDTWNKIIHTFNMNESNTPIQSLLDIKQFYSDHDQIPQMGEEFIGKKYHDFNNNNNNNNNEYPPFSLERVLFHLLKFSSQLNYQLLDNFNNRPLKIDSKEYFYVYLHLSLSDQIPVLGEIPVLHETDVGKNISLRQINDFIGQYRKYFLFNQEVSTASVGLEEFSYALDFLLKNIARNFNNNNSTHFITMPPLKEGILDSERNSGIQHTSFVQPNANQHLLPETMASSLGNTQSQMFFSDYSNSGQDSRILHPSISPSPPNVDLTQEIGNPIESSANNIICGVQANHQPLSEIIGSLGNTESQMPFSDYSNSGQAWDISSISPEHCAFQENGRTPESESNNWLRFLN
jgi:hypothetical protein